MYYGFDIPQILLVAYLTPPALQHAGTEEARWIDGWKALCFGWDIRQRAEFGWMGGRASIQYDSLQLLIRRVDVMTR
jgi:hypothetical protein